AGTQLVAYIVPHRGAAPDPAAPRRQLTSRLPAHLIPIVVIPLDALPVTPSGKLDRDALPDPVFSPPTDARAQAPPSGPVESEIAALFADLSGGMPVGRHSNFFELGGSSLTAITLLERLRKRGWALDVRTVFA